MFRGWSKVIGGPLSSELDGDESGALGFIVQRLRSAGFDSYESVPYIGRHKIRRRDAATSSVVQTPRRTKAPPGPLPKRARRASAEELSGLLAAERLHRIDLRCAAVYEHRFEL